MASTRKDRPRLGTRLHRFFFLTARPDRNSGVRALDRKNVDLSPKILANRYLGHTLPGAWKVPGSCLTLVKDSGLSFERLADEGVFGAANVAGAAMGAFGAANVVGRGVSGAGIGVRRSQPYKRISKLWKQS